jgi:hypothetical protein
VELIVTIAEFLIGDFAFGTTANLSLACHSVREETLPVLYETLCLDRMDPKEYLMRERANLGLAYEVRHLLNVWCHLHSDHRLQIPVLR